jgi:hypothetical protein
VSVIVKFDPYAKTGNRLLQFAFGMLLSKKKGVQFYSSPIPGFKETYGYDNVPEYNDVIQTASFGAHFVDIDVLLQINKPILVNSYLQKHYYYSEHVSMLRQLFAVDNNVGIDKDELVIHIRSTDYRDGNVHINDNIYLDILDTLSPAKASVVTDDINTDIIQKLSKRGVKLVTQNNITNKGNGLNSVEMYDYLYMLNSNLLLISQSTFSWWAAFLGNQDSVYVPYDVQDNGMWKLSPGRDDIDLIPNDIKFNKIVYDKN